MPAATSATVAAMVGAPPWRPLSDTAAGPKDCGVALPAKHLPPARPLPLPPLVFSDNAWSTQSCRRGRQCEVQVCRFFHSPRERRCAGFMSGRCHEKPASGRCKQGLHVDVSSMCETLTVDLDAPQAVDQLRELEASTDAANATFVRVAVNGFSMLRATLLRRILACLPFVHQLQLPDRAQDPSLLVFLCDVIEPCAERNPRLRDIIFSDGSMEKLWD
eukprot:NODE_17654_length_932_cov_5.547826.p1 GENE.NODE_17654_length_932_cov_5.547826~~NODE_17654_length_932_cov_5.547826.p1  ORF type:complete len:246 (+),score=62.52 NODE_17654_length_932_cov_5.547826:85-738(+)